MTDLTRTPTLKSGATPTEVQRWINSIAVRGNFDWMPGVAGYSTDPLVSSPATLGASYTDFIKITFTPRVKSRVVTIAQVTTECVATFPIIVLGSYTSPAALSGSMTDPTPAVPNDYGAYGFHMTDAAMTRVVFNCFDLAAGVTYDIIARAKNIGSGTAKVRTPSMLMAVHFPLLTPAGQ